MVTNLFRPRASVDVGEELLRTSLTPLTIPRMLAHSRARCGGNVVYRHKISGQWQDTTMDSAYRQAQDVAAALIALGLEKGGRAAIICENGVPWVTSVFGISLAGGVAVPLYVELKGDEVEELVERAGAKMVIVSAKAFQRVEDRLGSADRIIVVGTEEGKEGKASGFLRRGRPDVIPFDQLPDRATDESRRELARRVVEPDDLATIMFTSGTTGGMKGVMLTHENLMSNVESARRKVHVEDRDRLLLVLPMHHAFPFLLLLAATAVGGELTFENDLLRVRDRLREVKPTLFLGVPALFDQVYRAIVRRAETEGRKELFDRGLRIVDVAKRRTGVNLGRLIFREVHQQLGGQLRFLLSGGAALKPETALAFFKLGLPLLQGWGLTEAAPVVSAQDWNSRKFLFTNYYEEHVGTVGTPIDGVEVDLIDVPEKEIYVNLHGEGELVVRGPNVFVGYWQAPEDTANAKAGEWLRTGDLGRLDDEGNIWITGRSKYVIVLDSGEKVVPDELEERVGEMDVVEDVCIVPRTIRNKTQIGAVVYPSVAEVTRILGERGEALTSDAIRKLVQQALDDLAKNMAPHKRISELLLSDRPLPKTALRDVARGQLAESYAFDVEQWKVSTEELDAPPAEPDEDSDG